MDYLLYFLAILTPPFISGPVPAFIWYKAGRSQKWRQYLPWVIGSVIILNLTALALITATLDGMFPPGAAACFLTPIFSLLTSVASSVALNRNFPAASQNSSQYRWLQISVFAVPLIQLIALVSLVVIAPYLCTVGIRNCADNLP
jgi:uncharacterized membrane protein YkvI